MPPLVKNLPLEFLLHAPNKDSDIEVEKVALDQHQLSGEAVSQVAGRPEEKLY